MSTILESIGKIKIGIWQFWRLVFSSNREYPYHDYHHVDESTASLIYVVGHNQVNANGTQKKTFTSKSTLIYCTEATTLRFNHARNVAVAILANTWYEFYSNVWAVYLTAITQGEDLYLYFEGVLPEEARSPE